ncbi:DUF2304 domain-containing protein [Paenibacillus chartarius]|uniref:DUF2304 domain-containing protein n=1 Tax=Paenibacillus chartarius TaxID=747481 RepID=A0ABV6DRJ5_9BACL
MVPLKLQMILIALTAISFLYILNMIKKYKLELKYTLLWIAIIVVLFFLSLFPNLLKVLSGIVGIEVPSNTLFLFGIISVYLITFTCTVSLSRFSNRVRELTQELALLKDKVERLEKKDCETK